MGTIARILCPVDFAAGSRRAVDYAKTLASQHGARLVLLHVTGAAGSAARDADVRSRLDQLAAADTDGAGTVEPQWADGDVAGRIVEVASAAPADIIVMAPRAEPVLEPAPLGSITSAVLASAPCPVFVLPFFATGAHTAISHILCALDFAAVDAALVEYAGALAADSDARLTLLHIVDRHEELAAGTADDEGTERLEHRAETRLQRAAAPLRAAGVPVECLVEVGVASREILFNARAVAADLIVMGAQSRSGSDLLNLGSTTHDVMRDALCPVAVVPARRPGERSA